MVLVDSSVWIDHFRIGRSDLAQLLVRGSVLIHTFIIGELACGNLKNRGKLLQDLQVLPSAIPALHEEVLRLIDERRLWGEGIGWVDAHLLTSALISGCQLWTLDKKLHATANRLGIARPVN